MGSLTQLSCLLITTLCYLRVCFIALFFLSVQFSSVAQSCRTLCDPMNRSTPGLPVHHQLPEFTPTQVHPVGDVIQPSHPLSSPSPPAPSPSQHQSFPVSHLFAWGGQSTGVKMLKIQRRNLDQSRFSDSITPLEFAEKIFFQLNCLCTSTENVRILIVLYLNS